MRRLLVSVIVVGALLSPLLAVGDYTQARIYSEVPHVSGIGQEPRSDILQHLDRPVYAVAGRYLYFYNASLFNGSFWRVEMNATPYIPQLVFGDAGNVGAMDALPGDDGDELYFTSDGYDKAVLMLNLSTLEYVRITDLLGDPVKLSNNGTGLFSVGRDEAGITYLGWTSIVGFNWGIYLWNSTTPDFIVQLASHTSFASLQITRQFSRWPVMIYGYSGQVRCLNLSSNASLWAVDFSPSVLAAAYLDDTRGQVYYSWMNTILNYSFAVYDLRYDSTTLFLNESTMDIRSIWGTPDYLFFCKPITLAKCAFEVDMEAVENISVAANNPGSFRIAKWNSTHGRAIIWDSTSKCLRESPLNDVRGPQATSWGNGASGMLTQVNNWSLWWSPAWDLNAVDLYEVQVSMTTTFAVNTTIFTNNASLWDGLRGFGDYYYRVRGVDAYGNEGDWSVTFWVRYEDPNYDPSNPTVICVLLWDNITQLILLGLGMGFVLGFVVHMRRARPKVKASKPTTAPPSSSQGAEPGQLENLDF